MASEVDLNGMYIFGLKSCVPPSGLLIQLGMDMFYPCLQNQLHIKELTVFSIY